MGFTCLFSLLVAAAPRLTIIVLWLARPEMVSRAFDTFVLPLLGLIFLPFVTCVYILVAPAGVQGLDWLWLGLALVVDIGVWAAAGYLNRRRLGGQA